jgi:diguanylate cyclase (GGDEF)-like protein
MWSGPDPRLIATCGRIVRAACALAIFTGVTVLAGWSLDMDVLKSIFPGLIAMNPLTAICFVLSALALALLHDEAVAPSLRRGGQMAALLVALLALIRLADHLLGWSLAIDQRLFRQAITASDAIPTSMALNTAFNFGTLALALLLLRAQWRDRFYPAQLLALVTALTAFVVLVGYAYSVNAPIGVAKVVPMGLHTAFTFVGLAMGVLCALPDRGVMARVTRDSTGGRLTRRLVPAFIVLPPVVGWLWLLGERAGLYGSAFGVALMVGAMIALGVGFSWVNARAVDHTEAQGRRADEITRKLAYSDALTGLPNRPLFYDRLAQALARSRRYGGEVAILFLDLDGFKQVNDTLGHETGDALLKEAAARLQSCMRTIDTAARLAGDEFTAILAGMKDLGDIEATVRRMLEEVARPYSFQGQEVKISASIGISIFPRHGQDGTALVKKADLAMYRAKEAGRNRFALYDPSMETAREEAAGPYRARGGEFAAAD